MFYNNGLYVYYITSIYYDDHKKEHIKKDVSSFLQDFSENSKSPGANYFYGNYWGSYVICGDTIKIQEIYKGRSLNDGWHGKEEWYKIIDKNTIQCIRSFNLPITLPYNSQPEKKRNPATFVPIPAKPKPDKSWILKEKWFWCNENDWKTYMERLKKDEGKKN